MTRLSWTFSRFFAAILGPLLFPIAVLACSCADLSVREKFRTADVVFVGQILSVKEAVGAPADSLYFSDVTFQVTRQWKGGRSRQLVVTSLFDNPGWCGDLPLTVGERYLIYADREGKRLVMQIDCGPNRRAVYAADEIAKLSNFWFRVWARLYPFPDLN